ncbi:LysR family transcriptional regulator [Pendulispora albinea]|uniref:LysR family transcriptional regulator n=1 Tax=Pendulispora albinea TaxID=2741071 RepID=A0ABZ2M7M2_9BACT
MLEGVTIEQLRTLRAVAEAGSFSGAARKLGRVQAAVSQSIDRLEAQLELRLFDRSGRVPRLTRHGEAIVAAARKIEGDVDALEELAAHLKRGEETSLSIVVDALFPTASLVPFAKDFAAEHPKVSLVLFTDVLSAVTAHVRERRSAWGIAVEDADARDLERRPIADVRLVSVAAREHPLAKRVGAIDAAGLEDAVQIILGEHRDTADTSDVQGVFSPRTWRVVDQATKHALIASGLGWGHMPEHLVRDDLRAGRLVELLLDAWGSSPLRRSLVLVWRRGAVLGPVARWAQQRLSELCLREIEPEVARRATHHTT